MKTILTRGPQLLLTSQASLNGHGAREAAIAIKGCGDVRILGNEFASSTPPKQGA
jgi:hypothetical protein